MSTGAAKRYTVEEYLALERESEIRHEYFDGEIFAMAGGSAPHSLISVNCAGELRSALKARGCQVHSSDMRIMCPTGLWCYPDCSVVCDEPQLEDAHGDTLLNPLVVVEVLSKTTEAYDRGRKYKNYQTIESLRDVVLIAQDRPSVEVFSRQANGRWESTCETDLAASVAFPALGCTIPMAEIYANVTFADQ